MGPTTPWYHPAEIAVGPRARVLTQGAQVDPALWDLAFSVGLLSGASLSAVWASAPYGGKVSAQ